MNNFKIIIPARLGSTRLPNKMLLDICGEPLIIRTAKQALRSQAKQVIVATDHLDIVKVCESHNIMVHLTSPTHTSGTERIAELVSNLNMKDNEIIINIQGDEPLIEPSLINQLAEFIIKKSHENNLIKMATIAHQINQYNEIINPNIVKTVLDKDNNALYFSRAPIPFSRDNFINKTDTTIPIQYKVLRHIGVYAYTVEFLKIYSKLPLSTIEQIESLEQLRVLYNGYKIAVHQTDIIPAIGIDSIEDLERVRKILQDQRN